MTSIRDILLQLVVSSDTVNDWKDKTNAIIDLLNRTPLSQLPQVIISENPPISEDGVLWFNSNDMTLMSKFDDAWYPFHQLYAYELKYYKQEIDKNKLIPIGYNALSVSPKVNDGVVVEVSEGAIWKIV